MYSKAKLVDWCQCCQQRVTFSYPHCSSNFFRYNHTTQVVPLCQEKTERNFESRKPLKIQGFSGFCTFHASASRPCEPLRSPDQTYTAIPKRFYALDLLQFPNAVPHFLFPIVSSKNPNSIPREAPVHLCLHNTTSFFFPSNMRITSHPDFASVPASAAALSVPEASPPSSAPQCSAWGRTPSNPIL